MSVRWERLEGDSDSFAIKVAFHSDPDRGHGADAETAASWGAIEIWTNGMNLCAHREQGEILDGAHWYLLPFLEWTASSWDALFHEERLPAGAHAQDAATALEGWFPIWLMDDAARGGPDPFQERFDWAQRHALRSARDGGIFPAVYLRRFRDQIELSWRNTSVVGASEIDFLAGEGVSSLDPAFVAESLFAVISDAVDWLRRQLPESARLGDLHRTVGGLRSADRADQRVSWIAGLGARSDGMDATWRSLRDGVAAWASPSAFRATFDSIQDSLDLVVQGSCEAALLFGSASPQISDDDAQKLSRLLIGQYRPAMTGLPIDDLVRSEPISHVSPAWQQGYDLALDLHDDLGDLTDQGSVEIESRVKALGVALEEIELLDAQVRAASFASPRHVPTIAVNRSSPQSRSLVARRFTLAHELCHLLFDRVYGVRVAVASGPWAPEAVERRANAFAAMFLMPAGLLQRAIARSSASLDSDEGLRAVAADLRVSQAALSEHARNLGFLDDSAYRIH